MRTYGLLSWVGCYGFVLFAAGCGGSTTDVGAGEPAGGSGGSTAGSGGSGGSTTGSGGSGGSTAGAGGSGGSTAGSGGDDSGHCDVAKAEARVAPLDMLILMDRSGSMDNKLASGSADDRWSAATGGLRDFIHGPLLGEVGFGVQFFPLPYEGPMPVPLMEQGCELYSDDCGPYSVCQDNTLFTMCSPIIDMPDSSCDSEDYSELAVPITALPGGVDDIEAALANTLPEGGTPMTPAMQGAMNSLRSHAVQHPERLHVMVLATDGEPSGCGGGNRLEAVAAIARTAFEGTSNIKTFVIGMGSPANLDLIAYLGGTDQATFVSGNDTRAKLLERVREIHSESVSCTFTMPTLDGDPPGYGYVNFRYAPPNDQGDWLTRVDSEANCGDQPGWYYDQPNAPQFIHLCSESCDTLKTDAGTVGIEVGCQTLVR